MSEPFSYISTNPSKLADHFNENQQFKHIKHNLIVDCENIRNQLEKFKLNKEMVEIDGIQLNYDKLWVMGGYFFKYYPENPYAVIFPEFYEIVSKEQKIDLYYEGNLTENLTETIREKAFKKFTLNSIDPQSQPEWIKCYHINNTFTLNFCDTSNKFATDIISQFDAPFCKIAFNINRDIFSLHPWFYEPTQYLLNSNSERTLKFRMKGFYDESCFEKDVKLIFNRLIDSIFIENSKNN